MYDENGIEDCDGCYIYWDVIFSHQLYTRLPIVDERLHDDKVNNQHAEKYRFEESEIFFEMLKAHMQKIIRESRQNVSSDVQWNYGEYFDLCELIAVTEEDGEDAILSSASG